MNGKAARRLRKQTYGKADFHELRLKSLKPVSFVNVHRLFYRAAKRKYKRPTSYRLIMPGLAKR